MFDAFVVFVERDHIGDSFFLTLIAAQDELKFDTHTGASPGSSGRGMIPAIVSKLLHNPQHLPALEAVVLVAFGGSGWRHIWLPIGVYAWFVRVHRWSEYLTAQEARST